MRTELTRDRFSKYKQVWQPALSNLLLQESRLLKPPLKQSRLGPA